MRLLLVLSAAVLLSPACAPPQRGPASAEGGRPAAGVVLPDGGAGIRKNEVKHDEDNDAREDESIDQQEKDLKKALLQVVGKGSSHGGDAPAPSAALLLALRKTNIKLRLEPMKNDEGEIVNETNLDLKDSLNDRIRAISKKLETQSASPAEIRELQTSAGNLRKVSELRMQVLDVSQAGLTANAYVQTSGLGTTLLVANMVYIRRKFGMGWNAEDDARVKHHLARLRRIQSIAGASLGLLAAYEQVVEHGGDPKAIDAIANASLKAIPYQPEVKDEDVRAFVDGLQGNIADQKAQYEKMMRKAHGDANYEKRHKKQVDAMFDQVIAQTQEPQMTTAAPAPRAADPSAPSATPPTDTPVPSLTAAATGMAKTRALEAASKAFPENGPIASSLTGVRALLDGDAKGALSAAMNLVPGGGVVKDGLALAASLLFGVQPPKKS